MRIILFIQTDSSRKCIFAAFPQMIFPWCILESMSLRQSMRRVSLDTRLRILQKIPSYRAS